MPKFELTPESLTHEGYEDIGSDNISDIIVGISKFNGQPGLAVVVAANAVAHALKHPHSLPYDEVTQVGSVADLQAIWQERGRQANETAFFPGLEGWRRIADNMLAHRTASGRLTVAASETGIDLNFSTRNRQRPNDEAGLPVARVAFDTDASAGITHMRVEVAPDRLSDGRDDRLALLWDIDKELQGTIVDALWDMYEHGDEAASLLVESYGRYRRETESSYQVSLA